MEYDETENYKYLHLEWIKANPNFKPRTSLSGGGTYLDEMRNMYYGEHAVIKSNKTAYIYLRDDYMWKNGGRNDVLKKIEGMFGKVQTNGWFVTFGFDPAKWNAQVALKGIDRLLNLDWVVKVYGVFEYYGSKGDHPHLHVIMHVDEKYNKQYKMLKKLKETTLYTKLMSNPQNLDVKVLQEHHDSYLRGGKKESKQVLCEKDEEWRTEQGLPSIVEK